MAVGNKQCLALANELSIEGKIYVVRLLHFCLISAGLLYCYSARINPYQPDFCWSAPTATVLQYCQASSMK